MMRRAACLVAMTLAVWAMPGSASAQGKKKEAPKEPEKKSYVLPYGATILGIAIGLVAVCMPSNRKTDVIVDEE